MANLGENLFGVTKRVTTLHNKIYLKQEIAEEMDLYINEQVNNKNYIPIDITEARQENHQLHFVSCNFVVSSTSTSTKLRMTTNSFMKTEKGLSLKM